MVPKIFPCLIIVCSFCCNPSYAQCDSCHETHFDKINVHLLPSSHLDLAWHSTFPQYHDKYAVPATDTVIKALDENPDRRYAYVESAHFWHWWKETTEDSRKLFKKLVDSGRIEMVNGGWGVNDESITHYQSLVDQFTLGLRAINEMLGYCGRPRIGWATDPFGHNKKMASIYALLGYDALFFNRMNYKETKKREAEKNTEFIWKDDQNHGDSYGKTAIFATFMPFGHKSPDGFGWKADSEDEPIIDDRDDPKYNLKEKVDGFYNKIKEKLVEHRTNNYYFIMGGDDAFVKARYTYDNIDKLIAGFKTFKPEINVIYSTPSCYVKAVNAEATAKNVTFTVKTDDFLPYAKDAYTYWTGFYTTRPALKRLERIGNNYLQVIKQLSAFARVFGDGDVRGYDSLAEAVATLNAHNAITGNQVKHVNEYLTGLIVDELKSAESEIFRCMRVITRAGLTTPRGRSIAATCLWPNVNHCPLSNEDEFYVIIYNPLSRLVDHYVRLPVDGKNFKVVDLNGVQVNFNVLPSIKMIVDHPDAKSAENELVFLARDLPPLGVGFFKVTLIDGDVTVKESPVNETIAKKYNSYGYYGERKGDGETSATEKSDRTVFRPASDQVHKIGDDVMTKFYKGTLVQEIHQTFNDWMKHVVRFYERENHVEIEWMVGPPGKINDEGVEIVSTFNINGDFNNTFYTDSNGGGLVRRIKFHRESYQYTNEEPVAGNYFPVASRLVLKDEKKNYEWAILTDRAQGGTLTTNGPQLMIHRNFLDDLNDEEFEKGVVARGKHYFTDGTIEEDSEGVNSAMKQIDIAQRKLLAPLTMVVSKEVNFGYLPMIQFRGLTIPLPRNVQILTLEHLKESNAILLRLEHLFEKGLHSKWSKEAEIDLNGLFNTFDVVQVTQMSLGADRPIGEAQTKFHWKTDKPNRCGKSGECEEYEGCAVTEGSIITIRPYTICTFIVKYKRRD